ncbi:putative defense protein isoform X2 [Antedon mediterranea]|uniref:putative defense protein isoform X2 n=1 Tax=Antedon mediterranea TaxID=105859 RepID=UPI003AF79338
MNAVLIFSACLSMAFARSTGPPTDACTDMIPQHGGLTVSGEPPYAVNIGSMKYATGSPVQVTVATTNGTSFRGFFVQARVNDTDFVTNPALGMFSNYPEQTGGVECTTDNANSAWGHTNNNDKTSVMATWTYDGPCEDVGDLAFRVTVVQGDPATRYYTDIVSNNLMFDAEMCDTGAASYVISSIFTIISSIMVAVLAY